MTMDSSNKPRRVFVAIVHGDDILAPIKGSREPDYMTVGQLPASSFRFRFRLNEDRHDDSKGRNFDWWHEELTTMATKAREQGGVGPELSVVERVYENGIYHEKMWTGLLGKDAHDSPRCIGDRLLQFDLNAALFRHTWVTEEGMPTAGRWADAG